MLRAAGERGKIHGEGGGPRLMFGKRVVVEKDLCVRGIVENKPDFLDGGGFAEEIFNGG